MPHQKSLRQIVKQQDDPDIQFVKLPYGSEEFNDVDEKKEDELHDNIKGEVDN